MNGVLLDTHALLWWLQDAPQLSAGAREVIADSRRTVVVSAVSLWEVAIKRALGKLDAPDALPQMVLDEGFTMLPVSADHAWRVGDLPPHHADPFDRLLIAQAMSESLPLLSADVRLDAYDVQRRW